MNINELITDDELEDCFDRSSSVDMVCEILEKPGVAIGPRKIDVDQFAVWFAYAIEGFIDTDEDTDEWSEAWDVNFDWGLNIADNINDLLEEKSNPNS